MRLIGSGFVSRCGRWVLIRVEVRSSRSGLLKQMDHLVRDHYVQMLCAFIIQVLYALILRSDFAGRSESQLRRHRRSCASALRNRPVIASGQAPPITVGDGRRGSFPCAWLIRASRGRGRPDDRAGW
jgi:hypothetical protein